MSTRTTDLLSESLTSQSCSDEEAKLFIDIISTIKNYSVDDGFYENVSADVRNMISEYVGKHNK